MKRLSLLIPAVFLPASALLFPLQSNAADECVCPRTDTAPQLDGRLDDACWKTAAVLSQFTRPKSDQPPAKAMEARLCFDAQALYVAVRCAEPEMAKARAGAQEGKEVWRDDCVEMWLRSDPESRDTYQFIVNSRGAKEFVHHDAGKAAGQGTEWNAAGLQGDKAWFVEMAIPLALLGLKTPPRGEMVLLKLGREDYTVADVALSTWPPKSPYGREEGFGALFFESSNLLANPTMRERKGDRPAGWSFSEKGADAARFTTANEGGAATVRFDAPNRYCNAEQTLNLRPSAFYRLEARMKGVAGVYLRARPSPPTGQKAQPYTATGKASAEWQDVSVSFPTGASGETLIILGNYEGLGSGLVELRDLRVIREVGQRDYGPRIPVAAKSDEPLSVTKLLVTDCRALRGFVGTPVDGTTASFGWNAKPYEYNKDGRATVGVGYAYHGNDGLHVTFADDAGFNAVQIRGGAGVKLYRDAERYDAPGNGKLLEAFPGRSESSRALFKDPIKTTRVSFFELKDGFLADVSFFRLGHGTLGLKEGSVLKMTPIRRERSAGGRLGTPGDTVLHFASAPLDAEMPVGALGIEFSVVEGGEMLPFTVSLEDPVAPDLELLGADFVLDKPGRVRLTFDFPDQVWPKGAAVLLSLALGSGGKLKETVPVVTALTVSREQAVKEALPYRLRLLKTFFCALSEARPWNNWYTDENIKQSMGTEYEPGLQQLLAALDHCRLLDAKDPLVQEYYEWIWRRYRPWRKENKRDVYLDASCAKLDAVPGAPEWAVVARQAWLLAREVPRWWLEHRLVPNGELGGEVGDDTDMFQNYADFPMFERDGVAAQVVDAAERLADLAEKETLDRGLNRHTTDPLHAYEEGINHLALMTWWHYGDPVYFERAMLNAHSTERLTLVTPKGHRHFKSQMQGSADLDMDRKPDRAGDLHPLMWHPTLEVASYNHNPQALKMLREWADGWLDHMEPGKYAMAVDLAGEKVVETSDKPLSGGYASQGSVFQFLHAITGEEKYVKPYEEYLATGKVDLGLPLVDLRRQCGLLDLREKVAKEVKSGTAEEFAFSGRKEAMVEALKRDIAELQRYFRMYTSAEPFTDRVFLYPLHNPAIAYTGGYATRNKLNRSHFVSWEGFGTDYAALVLEASPSSLKVLVYNFADEARTGRMRLWQVHHGLYELAVGPDADGDDAADKPARSEKLELQRGDSITLVLTPRCVNVVTLKLLEKQDDIRDRADLAIARRELSINDGTLRGVVHNIGSRSVDSFEVALVDGQGAVRSRQKLGPLDAPLDLMPRRMEFALKGLPADAKGWSVVVDPEGAVTEIYKGNNRATIGE